MVLREFMLFRKTLYLMFLGLLSLDLWSQEFIASKDIRITLPEAPIIVQSGESVLFKYPDWVLGHEILDPKTFYRGVDLTGQLPSYIRNIFEPKEGDLPSWLQVLAQEQALVFKVSDKTYNKTVLKDFTIYSVFDLENKNGHIFLVGTDYVSHFNVLSSESKHKEILKLLERSL